MKKRVYLIPGFMCDETLWSRLLSLFDDKYEFIHLKIPQKESLDDIVEELNKNILEKSANILGFSMGGYLALYYSLKYPNKINKIMCVASSFTPLDKQEIEKREVGLNFVKQFGFKTLSKKAVQVMLDESNKTNFELIKLIQDMYSSLGKENLFLQMKSTLKRIDLTKNLEKVDTEVLFFYSNLDKLVDKQSLETLVASKTNFKSKIVNSSSHMLPLEKPQELKVAIDEWLI